MSAEVGSPDLRGSVEGATGRGARVAVIDSGWGGEHDHRVTPPSKGGGDGDLAGHGTACIRQLLWVAPDALVLPVTVFDSRLETSVSRLTEAIEMACVEGSDIVNLSLATRNTGGIERLYRACEAARKSGVIVVASAHNGGGTAFPAFFEPVLSVEADRRRGFLDLSYSPGAAIECVVGTAGTPAAQPGHGVSASSNSAGAATLSGLVARLLEVGMDGVDEVREALRHLSRAPVKPTATHAATND